MAPMMQTAARTIPCNSDNLRLVTAARSASSVLPAPRYTDMAAPAPTPKPMAAAFTRFCSGYTIESAVMASSLILATKKLSTMLYSAFTAIDRTIGSDMDKTRGSTGLVLIKSCPASVPSAIFVSPYPLFKPEFSAIYLPFFSFYIPSSAAPSWENVPVIGHTLLDTLCSSTCF